MIRLFAAAVVVAAVSCGETYVVRTSDVCACRFSDCESNGSYCVQVEYSTTCSDDERRACLEEALR